MKKKFSFNIESLLYGIENPKGAIVQVMFAKKMADHEGIHSFNRLARVEFGNKKINRAFLGTVAFDETLLLGHEGWNYAVLHLCIRSGQRACKIATAYFPNREIDFQSDYQNAIIQQKLSEKEITEIFNHVWDNMEVIQPHPKQLDY